MTVPKLYSYRRCPYAMRARMALVVAGIQAQVVEISFKDKPQEMLKASPKGTVPVLVLEDGQVIDESLDIMLWALAQNDPQGWLREDKQIALSLVSISDGGFKKALDRYKYANRFPDEDCSAAREQGVEFLMKLDGLLANQKNLLGESVTLADVAIFPFVRQFANVDRAWFDGQNFPHVQRWLGEHLESELFQAVFKKRDDVVYSLL